MGFVDNHKGRNAHLHASATMSDHSFLLAAFLFGLSMCNLELVEHSLDNKTRESHHRKQANKRPAVWQGSVSHLEV